MSNWENLLEQLRSQATQADQKVRDLSKKNAELENEIRGLRLRAAEAEAQLVEARANAAANRARKCSACASKKESLNSVSEGLTALATKIAELSRASAVIDWEEVDKSIKSGENKAHLQASRDGIRYWIIATGEKSWPRYFVDSSEAAKFIGLPLYVGYPVTQTGRVYEENVAATTLFGLLPPRHPK